MCIAQKTLQLYKDFQMLTLQPLLDRRGYQNSPEARFFEVQNVIGVNSEFLKHYNP